MSLCERHTTDPRSGGYLASHHSLLDREGKLLDVGLRLVLNHLVNEGKDVVALDTKQDERGSRVGVCCGVCTRHTAWVDEVLAIVLRDAMLMGVS